jgi:replicative DNA helicase
MADSSLPPQNIETEESILGGILLDPTATRFAQSQKAKGKSQKSEFTFDF